MRRYGPRTQRAPFRRHRRLKTTWIPTKKHNDTVRTYESNFIRGGEGYNIYTIPLLHEDNQFATDGQRFAKWNDTIRFRRIVGDLRLALYNTNVDTVGTDLIVDYGLLLVHGQYEENGTWIHDAEGSIFRGAVSGETCVDDDDPWLYRRQIVLCQGALLSDGTYAPGTPGVYNTYGPMRPAMVSTDELLPTGSFIDVHTKRMAKYEEKLRIYVQTDRQLTENEDLFITSNLRVLMQGKF